MSAASILMPVWHKDMKSPSKYPICRSWLLVWSSFSSPLPFAQTLVCASAVSLALAVQGVKACTSLLNSSRTLVQCLKCTAWLQALAVRAGQACTSQIDKD